MRVVSDDSLHIPWDHFCFLTSTFTSVLTVFLGIMLFYKGMKHLDYETSKIAQPRVSKVSTIQ